MKYGHLYAMILMFVFCTSSKGQNKTDLPKHNTTKDVVTSTVPNTITRTIKQDRKGNIWIATFAGVFRYDGTSFTHITSKVSSARFFSFLEDRKGNFWFSTVGSGVYYYDGKSFRNFTTKEGLANDQVIDIYEDKTGNIWFGTLTGASRYDARLSRQTSGDSVRQGKSFRNYSMNEGLPGIADKDDNDVNSIIEDKTGKFWFGTRGNACVYDARLSRHISGDTVGQGKTFTVLIHEGKPFRNVRSLIEDKKGNIWLVGNRGLWRYDGSTFTNFTQDFVGYIHEDKKGNIWTSSQTNQGWVLSRYDEKSLTNKKPIVTEINPNEGKMLFGILEANDGSIWFGADGVYRYNGNTVTDFKGK